MKNFCITIIFLSAFVGFSQMAGSLDPSFGVGGKVTTSIGTEDKAYGVIIQPDEKILVVGYALSVVTGKDFVCVRYNADGSLDNTFGTGGIVTTDLQVGSDDVAYSIALQADGKIILAGYSDNGTDRNAAMVRYEVDGTIDATFGVSGFVLTDFDSNQQDEIKIIKIHALTGKIIVGGTSVIDSDLSKPVVARYLNDGTLDITFNSTGIRLMWITALDDQYQFTVEDLVVQSSGKISAVGWRDFPNLSWDSDYWAGRINSDGSMDVTFAADGVSVYNGGFNGHDRAYGMHLKPDNSIIFSGGGYVSTLYYDFTMFEVDASGSSTGWAGSADFGGFLDDISYALREDVNGKFVMAGSSGNSTNKTFAIARKNSDASTDNTFGSSGQVTTTFGASALNECFDAQIQTDNKIVAVGYAGNDFAIARYLGDDQPDLDNFLLVTPTDLAVNQNYASLAFNWTDAFGATSYEMDLDINNTFTGAPQTYPVTPSSKTVTGLLPNTQYFWRVRASDGTVFGQYTAVRSFTTNSLDNFNLVSPTNNSTNQEYLSLPLDWTTAIGAANYEIEIDSSLTFTDNPQTYSPISSTYTVTNLEPSTDYYWHVRATNNGTDFGSWSVTWKFTTKADLPNSVNETTAADFKIYPSPANDVLYIEVNDEYIGNQFAIFDLAGNKVSDGIIMSSAMTITVENFAPGIYYLQIGNNERRLFQILR